MKIVLYCQSRSNISRVESAIEQLRKEIDSTFSIIMVYSADGGISISDFISKNEPNQNDEETIAIFVGKVPQCEIDFAKACNMKMLFIVAPEELLLNMCKSNEVKVGETLKTSNKESLYKDVETFISESCLKAS